MGMIGDLLANFGVGNGSALVAGASNLVLALMVLAILGVGIWIGWGRYKKWKRYEQFDCLIYARDGFGQLTKRWDKAGIFIDDKTNNKRFFLKKNNVGMSPDNVPVIPGGKKPMVVLVQTSLKTFKYVYFNVTDDIFTFSVGEEHVNWGINAYERQKKLYEGNWWKEYGAYVIFGIAVIGVVIIFMVFFQHLNSLEKFAASLEVVATKLAQIGGNQTTIITGG